MLGLFVKKISHITQPIVFPADTALDWFNYEANDDSYYKTSDKEEWALLAKDIETSLCSTKEAGSFVGTYLVMHVSENLVVRNKQII